MHLYLGTYGQHIYRCELDETTGELSQPTPAGECRNPSFLALHPTKPVLYAAMEAGKEGGVAALTIDLQTHNLTPINQQSAEGAGTCYVGVDPRGRVALAGNYSAGSVAALGLDAEGALEPAGFTHQHEGSGPNESRQKGPHAHCFIPSPNGRFALSCDLGTDEIYVYAIAEDGSVSQHDPATFRLAPGAGPRHLAFSPDERFVYVIGEMANTITVFAWDAKAGTATEVQTIDTLPAGFEGKNTTAEIAVHPGGQFVYGSNRGHDSIAVFARDAETGRLTARGHRSTQGQTPRHFALSPDGRWLLAANQDSGNVVVFDVCAETGELTPRGGEAKLEKPTCVRFLASQGSPQG